MSNGRIFDQPSIYQIWVNGTLDPKWSDWFDGFTITPLDNDNTMLVGIVMDQAALHGLLNKLRDLGLPLLLVKQIAPEQHEN
ncbi:MAG: hypothetical protein KC419_00040 [Anaerolineales bacterium]|nr:hypothetical protein [Anaerolineales bacterium]MCA9926822.1 hypothetical protein [Anaerolineales bacterium]